MRAFLAATLIAAFLAGTAGAALAAPVAGTQYAGVLSQTVDTKTAKVGQPVTLTHVTSEDGTISGGTMYGAVTSVTPAGQGKPAQLQMSFSKLVTSSGTYAISGVVTGMQTQTKSNAGKEIVGAVAGMLVGNMLLKTIFHASGGGFLGAVGGFLIAKNNRQNMTVPAGSAVRVTLRSVRRQATR
ncbi:MAG TPA: hypothetical protein VGZ02_16810 [Candidatus Baltobacteraceae bacterium]|jgi:hypothetical protein|nr:hypothetical protein [Candidatus Baltobacteraceae bacterium]